MRLSLPAFTLITVTCLALSAQAASPNSAMTPVRFLTLNSSGPANCDITHLDFCTTITDCQNAGGHWVSNACNKVITVASAGQVWMDRNLGASRAAISSTDSLAYGDLYQWGRATDGHEKRTSGITSTLSTTDNPGHDDFITTSSWPWDWRSPRMTVSGRASQVSTIRARPDSGYRQRKSGIQNAIPGPQIMRLVPLDPL